jgi:hypothetical protein
VAVATKGLVPHAAQAATEIATRYHVANIGGRASSGHINGSDHYTGHAIDVMVYADKAKGDAVANYSIAQKERWNVKYIIWYRRIWQEGKWTDYVGASPHTDHVHISFNKEAGSGGTAPGGAQSDLDGCVGTLLTALGFGDGGGKKTAAVGNYGEGGTPAKNFAIAKAMAKEFGWGPLEVQAWYVLGVKESGWRNTAQNPTSTAFGIGQFLDSTWGPYGPKTSDPTKQIRYMAMYIRDRYGKPSKALAFHLLHNWY